MWTGVLAYDSRSGQAAVEHLHMPTLSQRLRELDRRVLRETALTDAAGWTKAMSRWKLQLGVGICLSVVIAVNVLLGNVWSGLMLLPMVLTSSFLAGSMRTEYERAIGKGTFMGKVRPPGID